MSRLFLIAVTLVVWGALVWRLGGFVTAPDPQRESPSTEFEGGSSESVLRWEAGVFRGVDRVGRSTTAIRPLEDGYELEQRTVLALTVLKESARIDSTVTARLATDFSLRSVAVRLEGGGSSFAASATRRGDAFVYDAERMGSRSSGRVEVGAAIFLPAAARVAVARSLDSGESGQGEYRFTVLDPLGLTTEALTIQVLGEGEVPGTERRRGWRLQERYRGLESTVWVDGVGRVLAEQGPMGLSMRLEPDSQVAALVPLDVESATAIVVGEIERPRTRRDVVLQVGGVDVGIFPQGAGQRVDGARLFLRRVEPAEVGSYPLPARGWEAETSPTQLVRSDHPRIRVLAAEILGGERDALVAARLLHRWVYEYLEKGPMLSVPDAVGVLDAGRGDCNEHAVLLAALARAAGLPTRLVAGLVYVDGRFVYHAWNEIRGARGWLPVDAALGQFPADATHVALVYGEIADQMRLAEIVGKVELALEP